MFSYAPLSISCCEIFCSSEVSKNSKKTNPIAFPHGIDQIWSCNNE